MAASQHRIRLGCCRRNFNAVQFIGRPDRCPSTGSLIIPRRRLARFLCIVYDQFKKPSPGTAAGSMPSGPIIKCALLQVLPVEVGLFINVAYTTPDIIERYSLKRSVDSNRLIDALLKVINDSAPPSLLPVARRRIAFTSFHPQICAALNWKQPNCKISVAVRLLHG